MTALERIKEIEGFMFDTRPNTPVPGRYRLTSPGALPMTIPEDFKFLLKAFKVMEEIALSRGCEVCRPEILDEEFEERMKDA